MLSASARDRDFDIVYVLRLNRTLGCKSGFVSFKAGQEFPMVNKRAGFTVGP